jgi:hypothetical protein
MQPAFALAEVLAKAGRDATAIPLLARARQDLLGYLEVHIEQGPRPSAADADIAAHVFLDVLNNFGP